MEDLGGGNEKIHFIHFIHLIRNISYLMKIIVKVAILSKDFEHKMAWTLNRHVFAKLVARPVNVTFTLWLLSQTQNHNRNHNCYFTWQVLKTKHPMFLAFHPATRYPLFRQNQKTRSTLS